MLVCIISFPFSFKISISVPSQPERESILKNLLANLDISPSDIDDVANYVAAITPGYVGADLALVSQEVSLQHYKRLVADFD